MAEHKPRDPRCNVKITFAQWLAALAWSICGLGREPDETATGAKQPPDGTATVPEQPVPVGPTADSEQPRHEPATSSEPPPDATSTAASDAAEVTGSGESTEEDDRLPEDYQDILNRMVAPVKYSSRAELDSIFRKNLLIDGSSACFRLGRRGEKCYMLSSRDFGITWIDERKYWRRMRYINSRFPEVVLLVDVCWFTLYCKFNMRDLSEHTTYSVLLVYECTDDLSGLDSTQECLVTVGRRESGRKVSMGSLDEEDEKRPAKAMAPNGVPRMRSDEWMEVEIGELCVEERRDQVVEVHVREIQRLNWKSGIIIEGLELRAKDTLDNN